MAEQKTIKVRIAVGRCPDGWCFVSYNEDTGDVIEREGPFPSAAVAWEGVTQLFKLLEELKAGVRQ